MSKKSAIILLSGGLDSTICLWWAKNQSYTRVDCITFEYGSKEEVVLKQVTSKLAELAEIDNHEFITLDFLAEYSRRINSSLSKESTQELPKLSSDSLDDLEAGLASAKSVWIPGRNLVFLAIASAYSETIGNEVEIITGFNLEEGTTFLDNTQEFIDDFNATASRGILHAKVTVISPLSSLDKSEIVTLGKKLKVPFEHCSSCYEPKGFDIEKRPIHCGLCESCLRRKRGFIESSIKDPTIYSKNNN